LVALSKPFKTVMLLCYLLSWLALPLAGRAFLVAQKDNEILKSAFVFAFAAGVLISMIAPCFLAAYYPRFAEPFYPVLVLLAAYSLQAIQKLWLLRATSVCDLSDDVARKS